MHKIQKVSSLFLYFFFFLLFFLPICEISFWTKGHPLAWLFLGKIPSFLPPAQTNWHFSSLSSISFNTLSAKAKFFSFLASCLPLAIKMLILTFLIRLFKLYKSLILFSNLNIKYIKAIGYTFVLSQLLSPIYQALFSIALTISNPPGSRIISISFSDKNIYFLSIGILILLISWIVNEGKKLYDEQQQTI